MFPPSNVRIPALAQSCASKWVVVDLPLVPVTARMGHDSCSAANANSPTTSTPAATAATTSGIAAGTPGETITLSAPVKSSIRCVPYTASVPGTTEASGRRSVHTTRCPCETASFAAATPLRAMPTTSTRCGAPDSSERDAIGDTPSAVPPEKRRPG